jgi:septal ring factor EnvC (AmiA/AmiB activator)
MITLSGLRNAFWCVVAFGIVACASAPMPVEKLAVAKSSLERAERAQAAQFAQVELNSARSKLAAAQAAADKREADVAARLADQADVDAQLAEATARAKQQEQMVNEMDASLRDLRDETLRGSGAGANAPQPATPQQ